MCTSQASKLLLPLCILTFKITLAADGPEKEATQIFKQVEPGLDAFKHVPRRGLISLWGPHGML